MDTRIVVTGILKDNDKLLIVKRNSNDDLYPGAWEFPGGHVEDGETLEEALKRELKEEIGFNDDFEPVITHYTDEIKDNYHDIELDFIINVDSNKVQIKLSTEHEDYQWVTKDSSLLDQYIKDKLSNI